MHQQQIQISFRKASFLDIDFLVCLRKYSMTEHLEKAGIRMSDEQHHARVLEHFDDSNIILLDQLAIGVIKLGDLGESLHIRQLQILPNYQGKGIGRKVLTVIEKKAKERKKAVTLAVLIENPAKKLYDSYGFKVLRQDELQYYMRLDCV